MGIDVDATPAAELLVLADARTAGLRTQVDLAPRTEPLQFDLPPPFQLRVLAEDRGRAAQGVEVELLSMAAPTASQRVDAQSTDAAGVAQFAWTYPHEELLVRARSSDLVAVETAVVRAPLSQNAEVRLQLAPAAVLEVCVRGEDGVAKSGACVQLRAQSSLQSAADVTDESSRAAQRQGLALEAKTDASGCARFEPAPSGCVLLATAGCEGLVLASADVAPLEVAARSGPRYDVTVVDAVTRAPLRGASAVAWILDPGQDERTQRKSSHDQEARTTDKAGRAALRLPAPGWFALSASMDGYVSPAEMEYRWFDAGTHAVEVELQPASALDVFVTDAAAKPVAGALIQVRGAGGAPLSLRFARGEFMTHDVVCPTDSRGSAPRQKLPPGDVTVVLLSPDRSTVLADQRASLAPGGEHRVELRAP